LSRRLLLIEVHLPKEIDPNIVLAVEQVDEIVGNFER
jgi:hypothetical protein